MSITPPAFVLPTGSHIYPKLMKKLIMTKKFIMKKMMKKPTRKRMKKLMKKPVKKRMRKLMMRKVMKKMMRKLMKGLAPKRVDLLNCLEQRDDFFFIYLYSYNQADLDQNPTIDMQKSQTILVALACLLC
ncbi:hypothetical protein HanIR_Chr02g0058231 [Helianthus annuus]|nr:hypothetical protein HanIR_Chr02g0058231 [Helianthus annuus]